MPITEEKIDNGNVVKVLVFGQGDIRISPVGQANSECLNGVGFANDEAHVIGSYHFDQAGKRIDEVDTHVLMIFEKVESLDVLIEELQGIREEMIAPKAG